MAAAKIGRSPSLGNERPMTKTRGILLETMQLVEPKKRMPVPNHLLETSKSPLDKHLPATSKWITEIYGFKIDDSASR